MSTGGTGSMGGAGTAGCAGVAGPGAGGAGGMGHAAQGAAGVGGSRGGAGRGGAGGNRGRARISSLPKSDVPGSGKFKNKALQNKDFHTAKISGSVHDTTVLYNAMKLDRKFFPHPPKGR
ncbi:uncharacterized protein LOC112873236 [Panicum hallii]|uniref:uncharacterized protein LOC112873236 n=1 Tax=Panicum hallii TaxID=206008 RepID=UPI000DF4F0B1|nr:uncharacterized protein LOC112873236 [Panicum hallii]